MTKQNQGNNNRVVQEQPHTNFIWFSLELGFFAGVIWGAVHGFFYFMRFTVVVPGYLAEPFFRNSFLKTQPGYYIGWLFFIVFSMIASFLYTLLLRKLRGPWPGMLYGIWWWAIVFFVLSPLFSLTLPLRNLGWTTLISEFCLYLLWGLFIGYTAAIEYTDDRLREPKHALA
ncbi:YqhR family membrane protein [Paenibacillus pinistramenti]|uniref:YqhR family membrane protein n=1 Tax=Paenibacillus pinistramenti TaxID=1768003 RepID=UPI001109969B|nr:YqhR family membrane protein [Paenibacillus pinistramenti]